MPTLVIPLSTLLLHRQTFQEIVNHHQPITLALTHTRTRTILGDTLFHLTALTCRQIHHTIVIIHSATPRNHTLTTTSQIVIVSPSADYISLLRQYIKDLRHTTHLSQLIAHQRPLTAHLHPLTKASPSSMASQHPLALLTQQHLTIISSTQRQILSAISLSSKVK